MDFPTSWLDTSAANPWISVPTCICRRICRTNLRASIENCTVEKEKSADPSLRGSAPRSLVCVCLVPDHTPAGVRVFRKRSFSTCCATFRHFFYLLFRMAWVRIWMLFECFGSASPRALEAGDSSFLVRSVGDVSAVFRAAVSHGLGTYSLGINPAAVPLFRKRFSKSFLFRMVWASILLAFLRVP